MQKDWDVCDSGTEQSPIDVAKVEVSEDLDPLQQTYEAGDAVMHNRLHDFMVRSDQPPPPHIIPLCTFLQFVVFLGVAELDRRERRPDNRREEVQAEAGALARSL